MNKDLIEEALKREKYYKSRNEKAIERIEIILTLNDEDKEEWWYNIFAKDLLDILRGNIDER